MSERRPHGFGEFIKRQAYHSLSLVRTEPDAGLVKVGVASDPQKSFSAVQAANFSELRLVAYWWLAGRPISTRIEAAFCERFCSYKIRGQWFRVPLPVAKLFVAEAVHLMGTWAATEDALMRAWLRHEERKLAEIYTAM